MMNLEYSEVDGYVNARIEGTSDEVAGLVLALQERQAKKEGLHEPSILQRGQHKAEDTP